MIALAADAAADPTTWQRVVVTILTLGGFLLAGGGALHAYVGARRSFRQMNSERQQRVEFNRLLEVPGIDAMSSAESSAAIDAAEERWRQAHAAAHLEPMGSLAALQTAREPIAERIVREGAESSRGDLVVVAVGLVIGTIASVWGTWL